MKIARDWKDYSVIATGDGYKLERWKDVYLLRPDPQAIWHAQTDMFAYPKLNAYYKRSEKGGGGWLFPEQAVNWETMHELISRRKAAGKDVKVLNLFAYTGGATVACAKAGASVTHVDAAKGMVERAGENVRLSGIETGVRYIVDDCFKFVQREIRRGNKYDAIIMDPPSYGRGPNGEMWKIETDLYDFVALCAKVLSDDPLFFLINSYTTGLQPMVLDNILQLTLGAALGKEKFGAGNTDAYEVGIATEEGISLPCGAGGIYVYDGR